jgi:hypothetical protein
VLDGDCPSQFLNFPFLSLNFICHSHFIFSHSSYKLCSYYSSSLFKIHATLYVTLLFVPVLVLILGLFVLKCAHGDSLCSDVDSQACALMEKSKPDLCNSSIGETACQKYCGMCRKFECRIANLKNVVKKIKYSIIR